MPELPEVETMVRGIRPHVVGRRIAALQKCRCACRPIQIRPSLRTLQKRCAGHVVERVERIGKRVLLQLDSGNVVAIEPRMTGLMLVEGAPDEGHLRLRWTFADHTAPHLWFWDRRGLGTVTIYRADEFERFRAGGSLGPDALQMTPGEFHGACRGTTREIKVALLDQKLVAGVGNLYASEILHLSRIHPERRANALSRRETARVHAAMVRVLEDAIRYEGSTLSDGTYRNALNRSGGYQNEHRVYARAGEPCRTCGRAEVIRIVQAQRSTFYCPACQRD